MYMDWVFFRHNAIIHLIDYSTRKLKIRVTLFIDNCFIVVVCSGTCSISEVCLPSHVLCAYFVIHKSCAKLCAPTGSVCIRSLFSLPLLIWHVR